MNRQYRNVMEDKAKVQIIKWAAANPDWTPETLAFMCKFFIKHYGLRNRYLPPDFKRDKEEQANDANRVETNTGGQAESGRDSGTV